MGLNSTMGFKIAKWGQIAKWGSNSQNLDVGFPEGRIHQTERAGISHLKKVKTLIFDSPQGNYTRRKGLVFPTSKKSKPWFGIPRRATTPDGKGRSFPFQKSQNLDFGFPEGRLHQTERAGIFYLAKVKTLIWDSPKGDYTRRKGQVCSTSEK